MRAFAWIWFGLGVLSIFAAIVPPPFLPGMSPLNRVTLVICGLNNVLVSLSELRHGD